MKTYIRPQQHKNFLKNNDERLITLANGSECICHETEIDIHSPYLTGTVMALTMDCPFADIIIGETAYMKASQSSTESIKYRSEKELNRGM